MNIFLGSKKVVEKGTMIGAFYNNELVFGNVVRLGFRNVKIQVIAGKHKHSHIMVPRDNVFMKVME